MSNISPVQSNEIINPEKRSAIVGFIAQKGRQVPIPPWGDTTRSLTSLNNPPSSLQIFHRNHSKGTQNLKGMTVSGRYFMDAANIDYSEIPHDTGIHTLTFRVEQVQGRIYEDLKRILYFLGKSAQLDDPIKSRIHAVYNLVTNHKHDRYLGLGSDVNGSGSISEGNPLRLFLIELSAMPGKSLHFQRQVDGLLYRLGEDTQKK